MYLIDRLQNEMNSEKSYFRQHLMREDIARLQQLVDLALQITDRVSFVAAGLKIGWTPGESRTHELRPALVPLLEALHSTVTASSACPSALEMDHLWQAFETLRMDRLVGCLARVPRPNDMGAT